ncbi:hypothetical protein THOM_2580 [Trachipleistophora hominis]|uniref:Uncharacterized protein n=1 Tax=Trachipleistophora hominis TaxID=72359 RepID=L7JT41_TRAHO|nr:hypothetical protein THOM_2580 [Trachipleistophora hominis]
MFRMTLLLFWSAGFSAIANTMVILLVFAQYLTMEYIGVIAFSILVVFYILLVAPFLMIYYGVVEWYTFIPTGMFVFLFVAMIVSGEALRRRRHFYKRLSECVSTTNYLGGGNTKGK